MLFQSVRGKLGRRAAGTAVICAAATAGGGRGGVPVSTRLPDSYFDRMYAGADDPWQLSTRWYEPRKYAIPLPLLPHRRYRRAFEPGCSIGTLTTALVQRCDHVTAVDVADAA